MFEQINDPIEVVAHMKHGKILPQKLHWQNREFLVKSINLSWSRHEGRSKVYYFALSDNVNYFKLKFDSENLTWTLLETYTE